MHTSPERRKLQTPRRSLLTASERRRGMSCRHRHSPGPASGWSAFGRTRAGQSLCSCNTSGVTERTRGAGRDDSPLPTHHTSSPSLCAHDARRKDHRGPVYMHPCFLCWVFQTWLLPGFFLTCLSKRAPVPTLFAKGVSQADIGLLRFHVQTAAMGSGWGNRAAHKVCTENTQGW